MLVLTVVLPWTQSREVAVSVRMSILQIRKWSVLRTWVVSDVWLYISFSLSGCLAAWLQGPTLYTHTFTARYCQSIFQSHFISPSSGAKFGRWVWLIPALMFLTTEIYPTHVPGTNRGGFPGNRCSWQIEVLLQRLFCFVNIFINI